MKYEASIGPLERSELVGMIEQIEDGNLDKRNDWLLKRVYRNDIIVARILAFVLFTLSLVYPVIMILSQDEWFVGSIIGTVLFFALAFGYYQVTTWLDNLEKTRRRKYWKYLLRRVH